MNTYSLFNKELYRQCDGIAMGSALSPVVADFFLAKLANGLLKGVIGKLEFYFHYMNDTFIVTKTIVRLRVYQKHLIESTRQSPSKWKKKITTPSPF